MQESWPAQGDWRSNTMIQPQRIAPLERGDPVWARIRSEADIVVRQEPQLASFIHASVLAHDALSGAVVQRIADRLDHPVVTGTTIRLAFLDALADSPEIADAFRADIVATYDRDPATTRFIEPLLYFKGFQAIQVHRLAHWLWKKHRKDFALYLQSRVSAVFQVDIHPAARIGTGIFLDHATGLVVGETATIDDDVSILHGVTLGGTGNETGDRHPKIGKGVLIGAGATILGNIEIGHCARIAAGSVVLKPVPHNVTVAGVPARVIGKAGCAEPSRTMDQMLSGVDA
jgi:serine O-acetyltransferase